MKVPRSARWGLIALGVAALTGCVAPADFRRLERDVLDMKRGPSAAGDVDGDRLADVGAQLDELQQTVTRLEGRLEVAEHNVQTALDEARAARSAAAAPAPEETASRKPPSEAVPREGGSGAEVAAYRSAYAASRTGDPQVCIDQFRNFLQTYADSTYADDAAYWMAECYFKDGDFKTAVLRFDDVVARYPTGNKAADALYRQGEALLRLGPGYGKAAGKAFERVLREYPDSARAPEAKRRLDLLKSG
jgi:tol-pal system protein YbgF